MASAPHIWLTKPLCGTGVQMSKVYPAPQLRWLVWYGGKIVRFCSDVDQAFAWYFLIQAEGPDIAERLQTMVDTYEKLGRKEEEINNDKVVR